MLVRSEQTERLPDLAMVGSMTHFSAQYALGAFPHTLNTQFYGSFALPEGVATTVPGVRRQVAATVRSLWVCPGAPCLLASWGVEP